MTRSRRERVPRRAEGGWVGMLILIVVLLIVALLSRSALEQYLGGSVVSGTGAASAVGGSPEPNAAPTPMPSRAPMERARAVDDLVQQQSLELRKRVEDAEK